MVVKLFLAEKRPAVPVFWPPVVPSSLFCFCFNRNRDKPLRIHVCSRANDLRRMVCAPCTPRLFVGSSRRAGGRAEGVGRTRGGRGVVDLACVPGEGGCGAHWQPGRGAVPSAYGVCVSHHQGMPPPLSPPAKNKTKTRETAKQKTNDAEGGKRLRSSIRTI